MEEGEGENSSTCKPEELNWSCVTHPGLIVLDCLKRGSGDGEKRRARAGAYRARVETLREPARHGPAGGYELEGLAESIKSGYQGTSTSNITTLYFNSTKVLPLADMSYNDTGTAQLPCLRCVKLWYVIPKKTCNRKETQTYLAKKRLLF